MSEAEKNIDTKEFGSNVIMHDFFDRHGEKGVSTQTSHTELSDKGRENSLERGRNFKGKVIKTYSSDTDRTIETGHLVSEGSSADRKLTHRVRDDLGFHEDEKGVFFQEAMRIKKECLGDDFEQQSDAEKNRRKRLSSQGQIDYFLTFGDKRPDPGTNSPVETAANFAYVVDRHFKMVDKLKSGSDIDLVNISHDFPISCFLSEVLVRQDGDKEIRGFKKIEEIGGPIDFNEGFELLIQTDGSGNKLTKILFRNQEYQIDTKRLKELVEIAKKLKEKQEK